MAFAGPIKFADISQQFEWDGTVKLGDADSITARHVRIRIEPQEYQIHDVGPCAHIVQTINEEQQLIGEIWGDNPGCMTMWAMQNSVILGRQAEQNEIMGHQIKHPGNRLGDKRKYFLLLVRKNEEGHFERLGIALVERRLIEFEENTGLIQIR